MTETGQRDDSWIGRRVTQFRREKQWTLATLAELVGLSSTQLSRIESGKRQPSLGTLIELSQAFGVSLSHLVDNQDVGPYHLIKKVERSPRSSASGELTTLTGNYPGLQAVHLHIPPRHTAPAARHQGEEWVYVLDGEISVTIGSDTLNLTEGDAVHFPSETTHLICNNLNRSASVLLVSTQLHS